MLALKDVVVLAEALHTLRLRLLGGGSSHPANSPLEERTSVGWTHGC